MSFVRSLVAQFPKRATLFSAAALLAIATAAPASAADLSAPAAEQPTVKVIWSSEAAAAAVLPGATEPARAGESGAEPAQNCGSGWVCFYPNANYGGQRCQYSQTTANADSYCSWGLNDPGSIANYTAYRVYYWTSPNCTGDRVGSTPSGGKGNLVGGYRIRCLRVG